MNEISHTFITVSFRFRHKMWKQLELESLPHWQLLPRKLVSIISTYLSQVLIYYAACIARRIQN